MSIETQRAAHDERMQESTSEPVKFMKIKQVSAELRRIKWSGLKIKPLKLNDLYLILLREGAKGKKALK
jgi:hypothetical protein